MAEAREGRCPSCGHAVTTRAQPNTRLRCRGCGGTFIAPPLDPELAEPDDAGSGPAVERVPEIILPVAPVAPPADPPEPTSSSGSVTPSPDPEPAPESPPAAGDQPAPEPTTRAKDPGAGSSGRRYGKWGRSK